MIAVAIAGLALLADLGRRRSAEFGQQSRAAEVLAESLAVEAEEMEGSGRNLEAMALRDKERFYRWLSASYHRASRYPWLSIPSRPPPLFR
ncbi:MAG: hypothetical protein P4L84_04120 [Isosphaeraceae bacterium]|nr:hypothetical protein [Isosphaeraceae bacterium]